MEAARKVRKEAQTGNGSAWPGDIAALSDLQDRLTSTNRVRFKLGGAYILALGDAFSLVAALLVGKYFYWLFFQDQAPTEFLVDFGPTWSRQLVLFIGLVGASLAWFWSAGHYSKRRPMWDELRETIKVLLVMGGLDAALVFLAKWPVSRLWLGMTWSLALVLVPVGRLAVKRVLLSLGGWRWPTVIVGIGPNARRAAEALSSEKLMGYDIIAFIAGPSHPAHDVVSLTVGGKKIPILYYESDLWGLVRELNSPHLVVALEPGESEEQHAIMYGIGIGYRNIHIAPPVTGLPLYGTEVDRFFRHEVLLLNVRNNLVRTWAKFAKRGFDLVSASLTLMILMPIFLLIGILIKLEDGGPILFLQERVGKDGKNFRVIKFRSMVVNAHEVLMQWLEESPEIKQEYEKNNFKLRNDPRLTKVGRWLRSWSLDELPQLWNVINGDMSLVGPRPLLARELDDYGQTYELYKQARPGITGIWQISGRSRTRFLDRANLDAWYIRNWSLWYDLYILLKTIVVVIKRDGAY